MVAPDDPYRLRVLSVKAGVMLSYAVCVAIIVYAFVTWDQAHRGALLGLAVAAIATSAVVHMVPVERLVEGGHADAFFMTWSTADLLLITFLCACDGGSNTAIAGLYFLPLAFAALFYPLKLAAPVVGLTVAMYVGVALLVGDPDGPTVGFYTAVLAMIGGLCAWAAHEQERRQAELGRLSRTDALTGVLNRRGFDERFAAELASARRGDDQLTLVVLDLDGFKRVNDTYGHAAGDELLCWVAAQLDGVVRPADSIGRLGGDEFAVLLPGTDSLGAEAIATRMVGVLARRIRVTTGISCFPEQGEDGEDLYRIADTRLYEAKSARSSV
jgi:diguanylate cyclase (GGDEF)-like protein